MPYRGDSLLDLLGSDNTGPPTRRMLEAVADDAGEAMTDAAARATPRRTGEVAESWRTLPTVRRASTQGDEYESGTTNPHYVARFLEHGVAPHEITPKKAKALGLPDGARGSANHPGIRAHNMTAKAAAEVEERLPILAARHLRRWQSDIEGGASSTR